MADNFWRRIKKLYQNTVRQPKRTPIYRPKRLQQPTYSRPQRTTVQPPRPQAPQPVKQVEGPLTVATVVDVIKQAGQALKVLELTYEGNTRLVEPYSFREKMTGRVFYGWCSIHAKIHSFRIEKIQQIRITDMNFSPRWAVEF